MPHLHTLEHRREDGSCKYITQRFCQAHRRSDLARSRFDGGPSDFLGPGLLQYLWAQSFTAETFGVCKWVFWQLMSFNFKEVK
jgi:hypothetical protein